MKKATIIPKHDFEENWLTHDPILRKSEIAVSINKDVICFKLGDGITPYSKLRYVDLFKAIMLGYIYLPHDTEYEKVKLSFFDENMWEEIKARDYNALYDVFGKILITKGDT